MALTPLAPPGIDNPVTPEPPGYGFLAAVPAVDAAGVNWYGGVSWMGGWCLLGGALEMECDGVGDDLDTTPERTAQLSAFPFAVWAADACSTFGNVDRDWAARARANLTATESFLIAREVWDGALTGAAGSALNTALADSPTALTAAPATPIAALACVDQGVLEAGHGARGMVHMRPQVLTHLVGAGAVVRQGQLWVTPMGNIVVADAGYSGGVAGNAADGTSQWVVGTSMMRYRLSPVWTIPSEEDGPAALFAVAINNAAAYAMRAAIVEWDDCAHVAAEVNVGLCSAV